MNRAYVLRVTKTTIRTASAVVGCLAVAAVAGSAARGGFTPAWSYLPAPLRAQLAAKEGGSLYLPARMPLFYRFRSGAAVTNGKLTVTFTNRVRVRQGLWRWTKQTIRWQALPLAAGTDCTAWRIRDKTLQVDGNKVYWSASPAPGAAWRCVTDRRGRRLVLTASASGTFAGEPLAGVVASGLDVSRRTGAPRVSLVVTPRTVRRGQTVLVHGLAQGCTSGDTVTVISHAFSAAHSFAGVPAVFAQVGSAGRFSTTARIPLRRATGSYVLTARCGGGNLGVSAHLTVTR
jgi:hypothetical protein